MEIKEMITILSVGKPYSIANEATKEFNEGCTIWYTETSDITEKKFDESGLLGHAPVKQTMPVAFYDAAKEIGIPALAEGTFVMRNKGTTMSLVLAGIEFIKEDSSSKDVSLKDAVPSDKKGK